MRKIVLISIIVLGLVYSYLDYNTDYPEKFRVKSIAVALFVVDSTSADCVKLKSIDEIVDSNMVYILAIRFGLEYVSIKHEHLFFNVPKDPSGAYGSVDKIKRIDFYAKNGKDSFNINKYLNSAAAYTDFSLDSFVHNHSLTSSKGGKTCYKAQVYSSVEELIEMYNKNDLKERMYSKMKDYQFYVIPKNVLSRLTGFTMTGLLEKTDGTTLVNGNLLK